MYVQVVLENRPEFVVRVVDGLIGGRRVALGADFGAGQVFGAGGVADLALQVGLLGKRATQLRSAVLLAHPQVDGGRRGGDVAHGGVAVLA
nr:hypothetical protein [Fodinicola feengrottensis]